MSEQKIPKLSKEELRLVQMFKALGNPTRMEILKNLAECQHCICNDLVIVLPLAQSTVSQHLKVLKEAGLIIGEVEGATTCYCLDVNNILWLKQKVADLL